MQQAKLRLIEDFLPLLDDRSYCYKQLDVVYHNYRRDSEGSVELYVTRNEQDIPVVGGIDWDGTAIDISSDWGIHDELFPSDALTFDELLVLIREIAQAVLDGEDPAVDEDGDYMRAWKPAFGATPEEALNAETYTAGQQFVEEKSLDLF